MPSRPSRKKSRLSLNKEVAPTANISKNTLQRWTINAKASLVRNGELNGRAYKIVPMVMIVEGVLNGSNGPLLYTKEEMAACPESWDHKPVVVNHPDTGLSACSPVELAKRKIGYIFNTKFEKIGRLVSEAWIDVELANNVDPRIMEAIDKEDTLELSTGLFTDNENSNGVFDGTAYTSIARNFRPDHLAVLPDQVGACSKAAGAGFIRNQKKKQGRVEQFLRTMHNAFDPSQPRDEDGKWSESAVGGGSTGDTDEPDYEDLMADQSNSEEELGIQEELLTKYEAELKKLQSTYDRIQDGGNWTAKDLVKIQTDLFAKKAQVDKHTKLRAEAKAWYKSASAALGLKTNQLTVHNSALLDMLGITIADIVENAWTDQPRDEKGRWSEGGVVSALVDSDNAMKLGNESWAGKGDDPEKHEAAAKAHKKAADTLFKAGLGLKHLVPLHTRLEMDHKDRAAKARTTKTSMPMNAAMKATMDAHTAVINELSLDTRRSQLYSKLRVKLGTKKDECCNAWVEDVFTTHFIYSMEGKFFSLGYTATDTTVELEGDPTEVVRITEWRTPKGAFVGNRTSVINQNTQEPTMDKKAIITAIIANSATSGFADGDRKLLEGLNDAQLTKLHANSCPPVGKEEGDEDDKKKPKMKKNGEAGEGAEAAATPPVPALNAEDAEAVAYGRRVLQQNKDKAIATIKANKKSKFSDATLNAMGIEQLEQLAELAAETPTPAQNNDGGRTPYFGGQAETAQNAGNGQSTEDEGLSMPSMNSLDADDGEDKK